MTSGQAACGGLDGRDAARRAVLDALRGRGFAAETLRTLRSQGVLSDRDAGLAMQIALGTVRHLVTIEHVLAAVARFDRRRVRAELRAILYIAAYQIIWMNRVPVFAAVDEAVKQARRHVRGRSPGMVNAALRNLARAIVDRQVPWQRLDPRQVRVGWAQACMFESSVLPPVESSQAADVHLAAATGERDARYAVLVARHGAENAERIAWASQAVPVTVLQRNELRVSAEEFQERIRDAFGDEAELTPLAAFLPASAHVAEAPAFAEGIAWVQDPTAHAAALLVGAQPGQHVLDLCAAPGGKSAALAQQMQNRGQVVAGDASADRLKLVQDNIRRLGLTCVRTTSAPAEDRALGEFDAVLVDVPCSNTGVIARRPEARLGLTAGKLASLVRAQRELLRRAASHVRTGGRLVYSTCSLEPEENEQVVEWFLAEHPKWRLDRQVATLPNWGPRLSDWRDGGYAARLFFAG